MRKVMIVAALLCVSCSGVKTVIHTANDVARELCRVTAQKYSAEQLSGMSPEQWCAIHKNLDPFVRAVTSAQAQASGEAGLTGPTQK